MFYLRLVILPIIYMFFISCSGSLTEAAEKAKDEAIENARDPKYSIEYKGLYFYKENLPSSSYKLAQLSDGDFNNLSKSKQLQVADKLLSSMFFAYTPPVLEAKILEGEFISKIRASLSSQTADIANIEAEILNDEHFRQDQDDAREISNILTRFYLMKDLDSYFYRNWIAYILTQTIMFSPANELESTHVPNVARVYNRLVTLLDDEAGMRYMTYMHMISEDNWRRFRSPEDNGREMLEIFTLDADDSHVPLAAKALQNWRLDRDGNTLVIGLNENTQAVELFGVEVTNGDDFYRELAKSSEYRFTVVKRIVDFMFLDTTSEKKADITSAIISSSPESFADIFSQILFSQEYLLHTSRAKSVEESFFSLAKKMSFKNYRNTFDNMYDELDTMHQASMKYKLGRLNRVPLDTLSFASYHEFLRDELLLIRSNNDYNEDYTNYRREGWSDAFIAYDNFDYDETLRDESISLYSLIHYIFNAVIQRDATSAELAMFYEHMFSDVNGEQTFGYYYDMFVSDSNTTNMVLQRESRKGTITLLVLDYLSRIDDLYMFSEVE